MKQPKLRFKADDGNQYPEWEEKRLEEVAVRITRKNKDNCTDIPLTISSLDGLIDQRDFFNKIVASKDMSGYYLLKRGEFAYNKSYSKGFDFGSIKRLNLYDEGALSTLYICFALNDNEDSDFYQKYFDSLSWYPELQKICAEGARNHGLLNVSTNDFFQLKLHVPKSKEEQQEIASLFTELDNLIQSAQKELDGYRELKQGMLQKMFPKKGEKVPEIRFSEFTGDWEQHKLEEYLEVSKEKNKDEVYNKNDVLSVSGNCGIVNQIEFQGRSFAGVSVANYGIAATGDVVYTKSPLKANPYGIIKTNKGKAGIVSTLYAIYKPLENVHPDFIQIYFEQDARMNNYMRPLVNRGAKNDMKVSDENALKGDVLFPKKEEQIRIAEYFENLDNLIASQQQELEGYKELKKGLLQQMFC